MQGCTNLVYSFIYAYERGMQAAVHRWRKCIADGGNYVERFLAKNLLYQTVLLCSLYLL
jgi:hypothetical protein